MAVAAMMRLFFVLAVIATSGAHAQGLSNEDLQRAQAETLRKQMTNHLHLRAFDLIDELVVAWKKSPPFATETAVVLGDVSVPFGFGSGLEALIENHLADLLLKNPASNVRLAHCPACSALLVHSDKTGTIVSRGIDQPGALQRVGAASGAPYALFVDFEAEGSALVLRARITELKDGLFIVASRTLSSSTSSAALLRSGDQLVSAEQARQQYLDALQQRGPVIIPARFSMTQFASPSDGGIPNVPLLWLQTGAELNINHARDWSGSLVIGGTWVPLLYNGVMLEARVNRLLTGAASSLTHPNLYGFASVSLTALNGPAAMLLRDDEPNVLDLITASTGSTVQLTTYPSFGMGLDVRVGQRVGAAVFAQMTPTLAGSPSVGRYLDFGLVQVHAIGAEVSLWF